MDETNVAVEKLQCNQELWRELGRTKSNAPGYEALLKKIRVLSADTKNSLTPLGSAQAQNDSCV
jgi:hypothetical protein